GSSTRWSSRAVEARRRVSRRASRSGREARRSSTYRRATQRSSPPRKERNGERQRVIEIDVRLVISVRGLQRLDDEQVITKNRDQQPHERHETIVPQRVALHFIERYPKRDRRSDRHDDPADEVRRHESEEHQAER